MERTSEGAFRTDVATIGSVELSVGDVVRKGELERDDEEFEDVILEEIHVVATNQNSLIKIREARYYYSKCMYKAHLVVRMYRWH